MKMGGFFRSKSCQITAAAAINSSSSTTLAILKSPSPHAPSRYHHHHEEKEEEDKEEEEEEEEEYDEDTLEEGYLGDNSKSPATTPFFGLEERRRRHNRSSSMNQHRRRRRRDSNGNQFPQGPGGIMGIVVAALRKSLLVTCSGMDTENEVSSSNISWPAEFRHVTFDPFHGFLGLPLELQYHLPTGYVVPSASATVFGVSAQSMQCSYDHRGNSVPTILLMMQNRLYSDGGLRTEGIFRINAENSQEENVQNQLNKGVVPCGIDIHCLAGLIKAWFRELPTGVLDSLTPEQVMHCNTEEDCARLVNLLPCTKAALLDWGINLMADIVQNEQYNKMNARNIALVFAPNMTQMADPLTALIHAVQVMNFLKTLIMKTLREREETASRISLLSSTAHSPIHKEIYSSDSGVLAQCHQALDGQCAEGSGTVNLYRGGIFDRPASETEDKWSFKSMADAKQENETVPKQENETVPGRISPIMCKSRTLGGGLDTTEVDEEISVKLSFRKGVQNLCRHPVFQFGKLVKKNASVGIVNTRGGGEAWA